jgi:spermidine/putrescine transport system ATP-binding protein
MTSPRPILELRDVTKSFGRFNAVDHINLSIAESEFFTIVGPSGSGKTTMIRMLAGMDTPTGGDILLRGERINDLPANRRPTCMVFQSLALFPHRTVGENIEFPLKMRGVAPAERRRRAMELIVQLRLPESYYGKSVLKCSGGERQRVALARALSFNPEILFFDEPLSAIDYKLRKTLEKELKDIHRETGKTFVYITHSLEEAMVMSDRVGVLRSGRFVQVGTPREIYARPTNKFVSEFMGDVNVLKVAVRTDGLLDAEGFPTPIRPPLLPAGFNAGWLIIRPEAIGFAGSGTPLENVAPGRLYNEYVLGSRVQYQVRVGEHVFTVEKLRQQALDQPLDTEVTIGWNADASLVVVD